GGKDKLTIDGHPGANTFDLETFGLSLDGRQLDFADLESVVVNGKNFADVFAVASYPRYAVTLQGGGGNDTLYGPDQDNSWAITGANSGMLDGTVTFNGIENLKGRSGADVFKFSVGKALSGQIDGGTGDNTLDYSAYKSAIVANLQTGTITGLKSFQ